MIPMDPIDAILSQARTEYEAEREKKTTGDLTLALVLRLNEGGIRDCRLETTKSERPVGIKGR